ncbi:MAG TPA: preprotein translocase subunit SecG [Steroidobacteraceae bacterium]|nr:preprotein translocase subunit SecG [Steroidobacteraceae bacterium]
MLRTILTIVQVISALAIVGLVLLQRGKGADAGAGFGAGASGTVFGARGATTGLSRMTAIFAAVFMINSLVLTYMFQRQQQVQTAPQSLIERAQQGAAAPAPVVPPATAPAAAPAPAPAGADTVPTPAQPEQGPEKP